MSATTTRLIIFISLLVFLSSCEYLTDVFVSPRIEHQPPDDSTTLRAIKELNSSTNNLIKSGNNLVQSQHDMIDVANRNRLSQNALTEQFNEYFRSGQSRIVIPPATKPFLSSEVDGLISALKDNTEALGRRLAPADTRKANLMRLAKAWGIPNQRNGLRAKECRLVVGAAEGMPIDFQSREYQGSNDCTNLAEGNVRASFLQWLLTNPEAQQNLDPRGLSVSGATFEGFLDLSHVVLRSSLLLHESVFPEGLDLESAKTETVDLQGSRLFGPLNARRIRIEHGDLLLTSVKVEGGVDLSDAQIDGRVNCDNANFSAGADQYSFSAEQASIGSSLEFGTIQKAGFLAGGAPFWSGEDHKTDKDRGFLSSGMINLTATTIGGNLIFEDATLSSLKPEESVANKLTSLQLEAGLYARFTTIAGTFEWNLHDPNETSNGSAPSYWSMQPGHRNVVLDLSHAKVRSFADAPSSWPTQNNLHIVGFTYDSIVDDKPNGKQSRLDWIQLQTKKELLIAQPYSQLAGVLKAAGREAEASEILYAMRMAHLNSYRPPWLRRGLAEAAEYPNVSGIDSNNPGSSFLLWLLGEILALTVGFGYWPDRIVYWYLGSIALGGLVCWYCADCFERKKSSADDDDFKPLLYSLDLIVPPLKFGQVDIFRAVRATEPHNSATAKRRLLSFYLPVHKFMGWVFPVLLAVGASISALVG